MNISNTWNVQTGMTEEVGCSRRQKKQKKGENEIRHTCGDDDDDETLYYGGFGWEAVDVWNGKSTSLWTNAFSFHILIFARHTNQNLFV